MYIFQKVLHRVNLTVHYVIGQLLTIFVYKKKIKIKKYLFTIGAPRSGTTMIGNILNNHPNILISNENKSLNHYFNKKTKFKNIAQSIIRQAILEFKNIKKINTKNYQKQWFGIRSDYKIQKQDILIIGDKSSGRNSILYQKLDHHFEKLLLENNKIFFLAIIRNPYKAAKSYLKSHSHEVKNLEDAIDKILERNFYAFKLKKKFSDRVKIIHYENFLNEPKVNMINICRFLEIKTNEKWLNFINTNYKKNISYKINCTNEELNYINNKIDTKSIIYYNKYF